MTTREELLQRRADMAEAIRRESDLAMAREFDQELGLSGVGEKLVQAVVGKDSE